MSTLALTGGKPVFPGNHRWPAWPIVGKVDERRLRDALRNDGWGLGSRFTGEFAKAFGRYTGAKYVLPVSTGTAALDLAVKALGIGPGDEVIVPSYTFLASATCVLQMGATPVFADLHPKTLEMDPDDVERLITRRTKAIIPVHFGGNPCDMERLGRIARARNIPLIEDAAHAHGMFYRGKHAGTIGRCGCFSFQSSKNMTSGEGGALITNDKALYDTAWSLHSFGRKPGHEWYEHHILSWNYRITGFQSALLLGQTERLEAQSRRRYANGMFLNEALAQIPGQRPQQDGDRRKQSRRAFHLLIWQADMDLLGISRATFIKALCAEGVRAFGGYPVPLQEHPMFTERRFWHQHRLGGAPRQKDEPDYRRVKTPVAKALCGNSIWLGQADLLGTRQDMQGIVDAVAKVVSARDQLRVWEKSQLRGRK